jgi:hypothetical protein
VARFSKENDYIWVHDYHLMHVAFMLRNMGIVRRQGFFLHILSRRRTSSSSCPGAARSSARSWSTTWSASRPPATGATS